MKNEQENRRRLLKTLTLGSGAVATTQLPSKWTKPVVETVILPAHAQTTSADRSLCSRSTTICADRAPGDNPDTGTDRVQILFDGESCSLVEYVTGEDQPESGGDRLLVVDFDVRDGSECNGPVWDQESTGDTNWDVSPGDSADQPAGVFNLIALRTTDGGDPNNGVSFDIRLVISFSSIVVSDTENEDVSCGNGADNPLMISGCMNLEVSVDRADA